MILKVMVIYCDSDLMVLNFQRNEKGDPRLETHLKSREEDKVLLAGR